MKKGGPWAQASRGSRAESAPESGSELELQRIRATYRHYDTHPSVRARRNPSNAGAQAIGAELETALRNVVGALDSQKTGRSVTLAAARGRCSRLSAQHSRHAVHVSTESIFFRIVFRRRDDRSRMLSCGCRVGKCCLFRTSQWIFWSLPPCSAQYLIPRSLRGSPLRCGGSGQQAEQSSDTISGIPTL